MVQKVLSSFWLISYLTVANDFTKYLYEEQLYMQTVNNKQNAGSLRFVKNKVYMRWHPVGIKNVR